LEDPVTEHRTIGFVGLGNMGLPMAQNLAKAGHAVIGYDATQQARERAAAAGLDVADTLRAAVWEADAVITMLPTGAIVGEVYGDLGADGLLEHAKAGTLLVDCSTISVREARGVALNAIGRSYRAADAPVSGGVGGAEAGTLTFMVGCDDEQLAEVRELLEPMAGRVVHCGGLGAGQAAKICNNMLLGISMIGVAEAFALFEVASVSSGQCWSLTTNCPVPGPVPTSPANRGYQPGFATALMTKDLGLAQDAARSTGVRTELGAMADATFRAFQDDGGAGLDFSAIINHVRAASEATTA
jgi:3-hydroxyisobutyrate dehydrogenase